MAVPAGETLAALPLEGAILELGHWGLAGPLLERVAWPKEGRAALERALNRKSVPGLSALRKGTGAALRLAHAAARPLGRTLRGD